MERGLLSEIKIFSFSSPDLGELISLKKYKDIYLIEITKFDLESPWYWHYL